MVTFYRNNKNTVGKKPSRAVKRKSSELGQRLTVTPQTLDSHGRAVVRDHAPIIFVRGALPNETVDIKVTAQKARFWEAETIKVQQASPERIEPFCQHYQQCGGCDLQHIAPQAMVSFRQRALNEQLKRQCGAELNWAEPIVGEYPAYRRKTRLAVDARNPNDVRIGFRARQSKEVVAIEQCPILVDDLNQLLPSLQRILTRLPGIKNVGHISLLKLDGSCLVSIRVTRALPPSAEAILTEFAREQRISLELIDNDGINKLFEANANDVLSVTDDLSLQAGNDDFVQVNDAVNRAMIAQALEWLASKPGQRVADWFCGLGNFSLALAKAGAEVEAVEGVATMVQRARKNAQRLGIDNVRWRAADLADESVIKELLTWQPQRVLLDPSREGAAVACQQLASSMVERIVYVSCNPASFGRDAGYLLAGGYQLEQVGMLDMFPFTRHCEMMAVFTRT